MIPTAKSFASDNHAGMSPEVLTAMTQANEGHANSYGEGDPWTNRARELFSDLFGEVIVHFVLTGTAANVLSLRTMVRSHHAIMCASSAHLETDETGAPEANLGSKLVLLPTVEGRIAATDLSSMVANYPDMHRPLIKAVSIAQATEMGTVYSVDEVKAIAYEAHRLGLYLHMDGARVANAAVSLNVSLADFTRHAGVDVLSFGGCKNGMGLGEAVVFFDHGLADEFVYMRKQGLNLASKMRFVTSQFVGLLTDDVWRRNARQANAMASLLAHELEGVEGLQLVAPVQSNAVFAHIPPSAITVLQREFDFYEWDPATHLVRWMTAFDTTESDVVGFARRIREVVEASPAIR